MNGFLGLPPSLQEKSVEVNAKGAGDIEQAIRLIGIQEQHGAGVAAVSPLGLSQHGRVRVDFQVVAGIASGRQIDRAAHRACGIQRLLDGFRIRGLAVAFCAEVRHVENGSSPRPTPFGCPHGGCAGQAGHPQKSGPD